MLTRGVLSLPGRGWVRLPCLLAVVALAGLSGVETRGQGADPIAVQLANLREDIRIMDERMRTLRLEVEQLSRDNQRLREQVSRNERNLEGLATVSQLNQAIAGLARQMQDGDEAVRRDVIQQVTRQIEQLAKQTQTAIDALARSVSARPVQAAPPPTFSEDYPRQGITYTVQRGDTLSSIASRHRSTVRDIQNANQIADPSRLQVGQVLFIPQREQ
ncbi:MAG: LysM peptidoglycan-binding domain-containing protein [Puniceicoccaceae bacterium]|nr:MAG: LysM peptidoglycan-binding domain-containing protein [Puniceicoccaceae bacterium]